jgi:hypothetical protein
MCNMVTMPGSLLKLSTCLGGASLSGVPVREIASLAAVALHLTLDVGRVHTQRPGYLGILAARWQKRFFCPVNYGRVKNFFSPTQFDLIVI